MTFERAYDYEAIVRRVVEDKRSLGSVAREFGCSHSTVERALLLAGEKKPDARRIEPSPRTHALLRELGRIKDEQDVSNAEVARRAGYAATTVHNWLNGKRQCSLTTFTDLAQALGCEIILRKKED